MATKNFDIPGFTFFKEKNLFSGSALGKFNFKIWYGEELVVRVWYGEKCFSCIAEEEIVAEKAFPFEEKSLDLIDDWLYEELSKYKSTLEN